MQEKTGVFDSITVEPSKIYTNQKFKIKIKININNNSNILTEDGKILSTEDNNLLTIE